jgi:hypothetical protein
MAYTWVIFTAAAIVALGIAMKLLIAWYRFRGERVVTCPENHQPAGVRLETGRAARASLLGAPELRLSECSRWPEKSDCGRECLAQIAESPEACLVRNILAEWYRGKTCVYCERPFGEIEWSAQKPALLRADKASVEWSQVPAAQLPETLQTASPVCFSCHLANTLVREHPDLVTDRSRRHPV